MTELTQEQIRIKKLQDRVKQLESILSSLVASNFHILAGGQEWAERCCQLLEEKK